MGLVLPARVFYKHLVTLDLRKVLVDLNIRYIKGGDDYEYEI